MVAGRNGTPDDWRRQLLDLQRAQETAEDPQTRLLFGDLFDELLRALADPNHPINTGIPGTFNEKEIG